MVATLPHPTTVWSACFLANGDVATGCADGVARVFTTDKSRMASDTIAAVYMGSLTQAAEKENEAKKQKLGTLTDGFPFLDKHQGAHD